MKCLSYIPCANAGTLTLTYDQDGSICDSQCSICDSGVPNVSPEAMFDDSVAVEALATFKQLMDLPEFEESKSSRVLGMFALRSFAMHFKITTFLNLEESPLAQWCLRSLRSSVRELRIAAGYGLFPSALNYLTCRLQADLAGFPERRNRHQSSTQKPHQCSRYLTHIVRTVPKSLH